MVTPVTAASRRGLYDWLVQRFTAVYMVLCLVGLTFFFISHPMLSYVEWRSLFSSLFIKVAVLLFFASLLIHSWIGMWTIFTDYVKCGILRLFLETIVIFSLAGFFLAAMLALWGL